MTPKTRIKIPAYRPQRDAAGIRAFVKLNGRRHYLGDHGSPESKQRYEQLSELIADAEKAIKSDNRK